LHRKNIEQNFFARLFIVFRYFFYNKLFVNYFCFYFAFVWTYLSHQLHFPEHVVRQVHQSNHGRDTLVDLLIYIRLHFLSCTCFFVNDRIDEKTEPVILVVKTVIRIPQCRLLSAILQDKRRETDKP